MSHTPGPWRYTPSEPESRIGPLLHFGSRQGGIELHPGTPNADENARLCAAAPDLLAALMDAHATIKGLAMSGIEDEEGAMTAQAAEIEAVIVKATNRA